MIKILIVDDSRTETQLLKLLFESQPDMEVIGCAKDGREAVEMAASLKPDIITMDLEMPVMDGHTATRIIMSQTPVPIVVISSKLNNILLDMTYLALEAGAVSVLVKPIDINSKEFLHSKQHIIETVRSMSEIKVIKRRFNTSTIKKNIFPSVTIHKPGSFEIIAIGTSIGGPQTLKKILSQLPENFPLPIAVVQHMTKGFIEGFAKWLNDNTSLTVKLVANNEVLKKGVIYFAPDDFHFTIERKANALIAKLKTGELISGFCPSISVLLESIAKTCGKNAIGMLLTGMGHDGAQGLLDMKKVGAHTLIQDNKSCVVFGMAGVAQALGAVDKIIELDSIAEYLIKMGK